MYRLLIKEHNITKLKYLCITSKENYIKYRGSGYYWKSHVKLHGDFISTTVLFETDCLSELTKAGLEYSAKFDVVESADWANLIPESGYHVQDPSRHRSGWFGWYNSLSDEEKKSRNKNISKRVTERLALIKDQLPEIMSKRRKSLSEEGKAKRKQKIQEVYSTGKHDAYFKKLSVSRMGSGNPMYGVNIWKDRDPVTCPHCKKHMNDSPAAHRWHFDNCKLNCKKGNQNEN